jgi:hypothetical protein
MFRICLIGFMSANETLSSASPASTALSEGGPGSCARCEGEQGSFAQRRLYLLELAAESAVTMLQKIAADTVAGEPDPQDDGGLKYSRVSKALRMTLVLHAKFEDDNLKSDQEKAAQAAARQAAEARRAASVRADQKKAQKHTVEYAVEQAIAEAESNSRGSRDYGEAYNDLYERLKDFEDYSDFGRKSTGEIVEQICHLLHIPFDPALWQDEPWAIAEAKAKPAGSPFAGLPDTATDDDADDEDDEPRTARGTGPP